MIVDHVGRILFATAGFPGTWNDKTIVKYDANVQTFRIDPVYTKQEYKIQEQFQGQTRDITIRGVYLIADGGYHKWRVLQCPWRHSSLQSVLRWTKRLESARKDIEFVFGRHCHGAIQTPCVRRRHGCQQAAFIHLQHALVRHIGGIRICTCQYNVSASSVSDGLYYETSDRTHIDKVKAKRSAAHRMKIYTWTR